MQPKLYDQSRYKDVLAFNQPAPKNAAYFEHDFGNYALEGRIVYNSGQEKPWVLSAHGARSDYTKSDPVTLALRDKGYSVLSLNMSGHSEAGVLKSSGTSLRNNTKEVETFYQYLDPGRPKIVIGYSLGGTPALKLLEKHSQEIDKLILFYPGIYTTKAYSSNYGELFRSTISEPFSYRDNDTIELLKTFKGKVLLVVGEYDGLDPEAYGKPAGGSAGEVEIAGEKRYSPIPKEVIDMIVAAVPADRLTFIQVADCDHQVMRWMRAHPDKAADLIRQIHSFLKS